MYKSIRVLEEQSKQFKSAAEERGMTMIGLMKKVLEHLASEKL